MSTLLALAASVLNLIGYIIYIRDLRRGDTRPNLASWLVWMGITLLSVSTYVRGTGDIVKSLFSWSILVVNIVTFGFIVRRAKFSSLNRLDKSALGIGILAAVVWFFTQSAWFGNMLVQVAIVIGGVPTILSVWRQPTNERPTPWLLWGSAFTCQLMVIISRWTGRPVELVYPIIGILLYGVVGILALRRPTVVPLPLENETPPRIGVVSYRVEE
jgi:hypothetical protein